jgi:hypothetical protein
VLLLGSLEETHGITAAMVDATAEELDRDLGWRRNEAPAAELAVAQPQAAPASPPMNSDEQDDMMRRIEMLERSALRQEQAFRRVIDLLEANMATKS